MADYRIPLNTMISPRTMRLIDAYRLSQTGDKKPSRGITIDEMVETVLRDHSPEIIDQERDRA